MKVYNTIESRNKQESSELWHSRYFTYLS